MGYQQEDPRTISERVALQGELMVPPEPSQDTAWLTEDETISSLIGKTREEIRNLNPLESLKLVFSRLNNTSNISQKEAELLKAYIDEIILEIEFKEPEDATTGNSAALYEALKVFSHFRVDDAIEGKRVKQVTEHRRQIKIEGINQPKTGLRRFF